MLKAFCSFRSNVVLSHPDDVGGGRKEGWEEVGHARLALYRAVQVTRRRLEGGGREKRGGGVHVIFFFASESLAMVYTRVALRRRTWRGRIRRKIILF